MKKSGITYSINHNFGRTRIDSYDYLPYEKILICHNAVINIKSVANENKKEYYYNMFLENGSYKDKPNTGCFKMNFCILWMLYCDRIDIYEGIDVNETIVSKECDIFLYWYFLNYGFKFWPNFCNRCHDYIMNLSGVSVLNI